MERGGKGLPSLSSLECCAIGLYYLVQKILCVGLSKRVSPFQICYFYHRNQALNH